ncbi:alpha/beta-hydrolase [Xylariaceae sp. FL0804]|nr:alpha/beta-hydrolase [Xylariaceae sp. FL0804]
MKSIAVAAVAALAGAASARQCVNISVPVTITAQNGDFDVAAPTNDMEATNFFLDLTMPGQVYAEKIQRGMKTVSGNYSLGATYCEPDAGPSSVLQVLTHGVGADRSYWDLSYNDYNYSYVATAVDGYGFSTLAWDRLGLGASSRGDPVGEIQAPLEAAALGALTEKLRAGAVTGVCGRFDRVVHVGHSFGSVLTYALTAAAPGAGLSDGIALTGFSQDGSFFEAFALGAGFGPARDLAHLADYPAGWLASDRRGLQTAFLSRGMFDPALLALAYATQQPAAVGEMLTVSSAAAVVSRFAGPALIVTGARDIPFCGGNCLAAPANFSSIPQAALPPFLPHAKNPRAVIVPGAGHGLNLEYSHPFTYATINDYFVSNGLGPK